MEARPSRASEVPAAGAAPRAGAAAPPLAARLPRPTVAPSQSEGFWAPLRDAGGAASELIRDFRASDRFFKYKLAVVVLWLSLTVFSVLVAIPSAQRGPDNELDARVHLQHERLLDYTALYLENAGAADWADVKLRLNGVYVAAIPEVAAGRNVVVDLRKFTGPDGTTPGRDVLPRQLELRCSRGEAVFDLTR